MSALFGTFEFKILYGTFRPTYVPDNGLTEIDIIPSPDNTAPVTVLQQGGRQRRRIAFSAYVEDWNHYENLFHDYIAANVKEFFDSETGISLNCIIEVLSEPEFFNSGYIQFNVELIEA